MEKYPSFQNPMETLTGEELHGSAFQDRKWEFVVTAGYSVVSSSSFAIQEEDGSLAIGSTF